jgi:hypothetical protein
MIAAVPHDVRSSEYFPSLEVTAKFARPRDGRRVANPDRTAFHAPKASSSEAPT